MRIFIPQIIAIIAVNITRPALQSICAAKRTALLSTVYDENRVVLFFILRNVNDQML